MLTCHTTVRSSLSRSASSGKSRSASCAAMLAAASAATLEGASRMLCRMFRETVVRAVYSLNRKSLPSQFRFKNYSKWCSCMHVA